MARRGEPDAALDALATDILDACVEVHRTLGPGFAESVYEQALCVELGRRAIPYARQFVVPIAYKGTAVGVARLDLLIDERLVVELKAIDALCDVHLAQVASYLRATGLPLGLLVNFHTPVLLRGVRRVLRPQNPGAPGALAPLAISPGSRPGR